jgi:hypothetical protein
LLLLIGLVVGGLGVFRYHQVSSLAREAARYAAVHGTEYATETGQPAATPASIYEEVILPRSVGLDPSQLSCTVSWDQNNAPTHVLPDETERTNIVTVTVTYQWLPEAYLGGITLSSTSKIPMSH